MARMHAATFARISARRSGSRTSARSVPTDSPNPRDFLTPVAAFEAVEGDFQLVAKFGGRLWSAKIDHSPLDVVAWHGNYAPYKYDVARFNAIGTRSIIPIPRFSRC